MIDEEEFGEYVDKEGDIFNGEPEEYKNYDEATKNYLRRNKSIKKRRIKWILILLITVLIVFILEYKAPSGDITFSDVYSENCADTILFGSWNSEWDIKMKVETNIIKGSITIFVLRGRFRYDTYTEEDIEKVIVLDKEGLNEEEIYVGDSPTYDEKTVIIKTSSDFATTYVNTTVNYKIKNWERWIEKLIR